MYNVKFMFMIMSNVFVLFNWCKTFIIFAVNSEDYMERGRVTERQRQTETDRDRQRQRQSQRDSESDRNREKVRTVLSPFHHNIIYVQFKLSQLYID